MHRPILTLLLLALAATAQPGTIQTIAGGFLGDGGPATLAGLASPSGLARAADGTLYIADTNNHRVRKVSPDGVISTVAGTGISGYSGDGGPASEARLWFPRSLALDSAELLNVRREFMVNLLDDRTIPSVGVSVRRRIEEPVLLAFPERRNAARHEAIRQMAGMRLKQASMTS
jgi:hypothetical protein